MRVITSFSGLTMSIFRKSTTLVPKSAKSLLPQKKNYSHPFNPQKFKARPQTDHFILQKIP
jgi:hypothetical protein